jgi:hypothetical protein
MLLPSFRQFWNLSTEPSGPRDAISTDWDGGPTVERLALKRAPLEDDDPD